MTKLLPFGFALASHLSRVGAIVFDRPQVGEVAVSAAGEGCMAETINCVRDCESIGAKVKSEIRRSAISRFTVETLSLA
jgi:hypothetical protein